MISNNEIHSEFRSQDFFENAKTDVEHHTESEKTLTPMENENPEQEKKESEKEKPKTKFEKVKETIVEWSQDTGFQAYPKMFQEEAHLVVRLIWLIVFLGFSGVTCYLCVQNILVYLQWGTVSTIEIVREVPTQFPVVTICDSNPFTSSNAQSLLETLALEKFNVNISSMNNTEFSAFKENLTNYAKIVVNNPAFGDANRQLLGFSSLSSIVLQKRFDLDDFDFPTNFLWYWHANYGNCYQFNTGIYNTSYNMSTLKTQASEGDQFGLYIK